MKKLVIWILVAVIVCTPTVTCAQMAGLSRDTATEPETVEASAEKEVTEETAVDQVAADEEAADEANAGQAASDEEITDETTADQEVTEYENSGEDTSDSSSVEEEPSEGDFGDEEEMNLNDAPEVLTADRGTIAEVTFEDGSTSTFSDVSNLIASISNYGGKTFTVKLLSNISTKDIGMFPAPSGSNMTLDLNGFSINRHEANAEYDTDENLEVIIAYASSRLTIIDSDPEREHGGYLDGEEGDFQIWFENQSNWNKIIKGGVIAGGASDNGAGGITIKDNATVIMKGGTIAGNISYDGGGGVQLRNDGARFILDGGKIMYNGAWRERGGGIKAQEGRVEIISGDIMYNWAHEGYSVDGDGGGIYINEEDERALYIHGTDTSSDGEETRSVNISYNYAEDEGGAIYLDEGTSTILNAAIENNRCSDGDGGGIIINDDGKGGSLTAVTGCLIRDNRANGDGGGIAITDENYVQIANCIITGNNANDEGGGVYFNAYGDGCNMTGCTVTGNHAKRNGGGIHLYDTVAIGGKMIVKDNTADDGRNNLYNYGYLTNPNLKITDLSYDSEMYIHSDWDNDKVITEGTTIGSAKGMFGEGDYHFEKINDPTSADYRKIVQRAGKAEPQKAEAVKVWDKVNRDQTADATNLGYTMQVDESKGTINGAPVYRGYLRFSDAMKTIEGYYHTMNYYYSDGLFFNDPTDYDKHLASLTASLTMASGAASKGITTVLDPATQKNRFNYLTQVFSDIGCTNDSMYVNDCYQRKPEKDTMGVAMANKTIYKDNVETEDNAYLLIPIFVRSYNYGPEWMSNFTLGDGKDNNGEAKGFSSSADIVMTDLGKYIEGHPEVKTAISKGKAIFWLGGYSRGGAVTNIVAKRVTDQYTGGSQGTAKGNTVFAYCKSAAQGAIEALDKEGGYRNIHNIINKSDIVTYVGPNEMGLKRYGVDHYLPGGEAGQVTSTTKEYGPDDKPLTIYSDNQSYDVDYRDGNYMQLRKKFLGQMAAILPDMEFNDYFSAAEINYLWGNNYTSWVPVLGEDMITEAEYVSLSTKEKFCQQFWARLLKYSSNSLNAGHDTRTAKDSKDYREFYANDTNSHFKPGSKYANQGNVSLQEALCTIIGIAMGGEKELDLTNMVDLTGAATDIALDAYDELIGDLYDCSDERYTWWIDKVWGLLTDDLTEDQKGKGYQNLKDILGEDIEKANAIYPTLLAMTFDLVNDDYNDTNKGQYLLGTMAYNATDIINDHLVNIAWIRADDDWYADDVDKVYDIKINTSTPDAPGAYLSAASAGKPETAVPDGGTANADVTRKLYLRTQPGGAVYYTMTVDGKETVSDALYQGGDGIALPAGKTVKITTYAKAYDQKGSEAVYTAKVAPLQNISKAKVTGIKAEYTYTGRLLKPVPVLTLNGAKLINGTDYTVKYGNNKNVGQAKAVITGKGKYTGTISKVFKILPKGTSIKKLKKAKKAVTVKWKKQTAKMSASRITGYQIQLATDKKFKKNKKTVTVKGFKKTSKKIRKLKAKKKYFVRIRTFKTVNGVKYYSAWSKAKKVKL